MAFMSGCSVLGGLVDFRVPKHLFMGFVIGRFSQGLQGLGRSG